MPLMVEQRVSGAAQSASDSQGRLHWRTAQSKVLPVRVHCVSTQPPSTPQLPSSGQAPPNAGGEVGVHA